jgi:hypothetical protein
VVLAAALNDLERTETGARLIHPRHEVTFTAAGMAMAPRRGGPAWQWTLTGVEAEGAPVADVLAAVSPALAGRVVEYARGGLVEQYVPRAATVEQQFVLPAPLALGGADLTIAGRVTSPGTFEATEAGWQWATADGAVTLGDVTVFDATGARLPATLAVTAETTRIVVDGAALATATYPVTVDPEVGTNDFRISDMGPDGNTGFQGAFPAVAYNPTANEYLVVWSGDDNTAPLVDQEFEIFGQRLDGTTGAQIGPNDFRISDMGPDGNTNFGAFVPDVAYNPTADQYLVVWSGDDNGGRLVDNEFEIFGQLLSAQGGHVGVNDFSISVMGPDGDANFDAFNPAVAIVPSALEYLVVWEGDDNILPLVDNEFEIFGQRINAPTGDPIGFNVRISDMGPNGNTSFGTFNPAVVGNPSTQQFLVVWSGDDDGGGLVQGEFEIFGQLIAFGAHVGQNDFRISDMGPDGNPNADAFRPAVAYNSISNEYLVVWSGDDQTGSLVNEEFEIFGQRLDGTTVAQVGPNDFRISDMGPDGDANFDASDPAVAYDATANEFLVAWHGDDNTPTTVSRQRLVDQEFEIFAQRLTATGAEVGTNDFRLSDMGADNSTTFNAFEPVVVYNPTAKESLIVWHGDDSTAPLVDQEFEIFGQRYAVAGAPPPTPTPTPTPTPGGAPVFGSAMFPSNTDWTIAFQYTGGTAPFSLFYAQSMAGPAVGGFGPGTIEPAVAVPQPWTTPVACKLQPGAVAHNNVPGQSWWVWVQDAQGRLSNRAEVQNMPSTAACN